LHARIGEYKSPPSMARPRVLSMSNIADPKTFDDARAGIPVTVQRRFDVYPDVSRAS